MKKIKHMIMILVIIALAPKGSLQADETKQARLSGGPDLAQKISIPALLNYAYDNNPSIKSAKQAWRSQIEKYRVVTGYPDPQLSVTYFPSPIETRLGPQDWNLTLSQKIPFPGKLTKAGEIAATDAKIAKLKVDKAVRDISVAIKQSFYELYYIRAAKKIAWKNHNLLEQLRKMGESAYAQNRAVFLDVVKSQSQTGQLQYDILLLEELEQTETARMNGLLNRPADAHLGELIMPVFLPPVYNITEIYKMAEDNLEEILMAGLDIEKAGKNLELAKLKNMPDFKLGIFYAGVGNPDVASPPPDAGDDAFGIQFGITIPIWFGKNSGRTQSALAKIRKKKSDKDALINEIHTQVRVFWFKLKNSQRLMELYENNLLPQSIKSLETAETWFREGEGSFSDFIEAQAAAYNFQLSLERARADYGKSLANLERLSGTSLTIKNARENKEAK